MPKESHSSKSSTSQVDHNSITAWVLTNLPLIFILFGIVFILLGYLLPENPAQYPEIKFAQYLLTKLPTAFRNMGSTILGAGIFAAVLKSFQFTGIFQKELAKVVYSSEYLEKQSKAYLEETWTRVSSAMITHKFPKIKNQIESSILNTYFPSEHNYYYESVLHNYENFRLTIEDGHPYITCQHTMSADIVPIEKKGEFLWSVNYTWREDNNSFRKISILNIKHNGEVIKDLKAQFEESIKSGDFEVTLSCEKEGTYSFEKVEIRKFRLDIPTNEQLAFETSKVTKRMTVIVNYDPNQLGISFVNKSIAEFKDMHTSSGSFVKDYDDILLPSHGFCLILYQTIPK